LAGDITNDILHGIKKIADYMRQLGFDMTERRCFDWVAAGRIPHTKVGAGIISSKSAIGERFLRGMTKDLRLAPDADNGFAEQQCSKQDKSYRDQWPRSEIKNCP
jgi:hypothetical protein